MELWAKNNNAFYLAEDQLLSLARYFVIAESQDLMVDDDVGGVFRGAAP